MGSLDDNSQSRFIKKKKKKSPITGPDQASGASPRATFDSRYNSSTIVSRDVTTVMIFTNNILTK